MKIAEVLLYRLESVSDGSAILHGSSSIGDSPDLLVRAAYIAGSSINDLSLKIDQELSWGKSWSRNISFLRDLKAGQSII